MSNYIPDVWVIVEFRYVDHTIHKVLAGWFGGFVDGDSWKLSSGVTKIEEFDNHYEILNHSGSIYKCNKYAEKTSMVTFSEYTSWSELSKLHNFEISIEDIEDIIGRYIETK